MIYLGNQAVGVAVDPSGWTCEKVTATACSNALQVKTLLQSIIGNHKRAIITSSLDYDTAKATNRKFLSATLYDGFALSLFARNNTTSPAIQTVISNVGTEVWTTIYDLVLFEGEELVVWYKD